MTGTANPKQVAYAMALLRKAGYRTDYMDASFKALGAGMRERSGRVETWLAGMPKADISKLIDRIK